MKLNLPQKPEYQDDTVWQQVTFWSFYHNTLIFKSLPVVSVSARLLSVGSSMFVFVVAAQVVLRGGRVHRSRNTSLSLYWAGSIGMAFKTWLPVQSAATCHSVTWSLCSFRAKANKATLRSHWKCYTLGLFTWKYSRSFHLCCHRKFI